MRKIGAPVRGADGAITGLQGVFQDISDKRKAERLSTTLESITNAFYTLDRKWHFTCLNREADRLFRRAREPTQFTVS